MRRLKAFLLGMYEFRSDFTTNFDHIDTDEGDELQERYDSGRDWAHALTLRHWDGA